MPSPSRSVACSPPDTRHGRAAPSALEPRTHAAPGTQHRSTQHAAPSTRCCAHCIEPGRTLPRLSDHGHLPAGPSATAFGCCAGNAGSRPSRPWCWRSASAPTRRCSRWSNSLLLKPRPGAPDAELAGVYSRDRTQADAYRGFSYPNYADLRARTDLFRSLTAHTFSLVGLGEGDGDAARLRRHRDRQLLRHLRRAAAPRPDVLRGRGASRRRHPGDDPELRRVAADGRRHRPRRIRRSASTAGSSPSSASRRAGSADRWCSSRRISGCRPASTTRSRTTSSATGCRRRWPTGGTTR